MFNNKTVGLGALFLCGLLSSEVGWTGHEAYVKRFKERPSRTQTESVSSEGDIFETEAEKVGTGWSVLQAIREINPRSAELAENDLQQPARKKKSELDAKQVERTLKSIITLLESHRGKGAFHLGAKLLEELVSIHRQSAEIGSSERLQELRGLEKKAADSTQLFNKLPKIRVTRADIETVLEDLNRLNRGGVVSTLLNKQFVLNKHSVKVGSVFLGAGLIFEGTGGIGFGRVRDSFGRRYLALGLQGSVGIFSLGPILGCRFIDSDDSVDCICGDSTETFGIGLGVGVGSDVNEVFCCGIRFSEDDNLFVSKVFRLLPLSGKDYSFIRRELGITYPEFEKK